MDLKQMQYFTACAQTGSFSEAAKILYSTQPSVSKVVKALEDSLGMQLFERLPRGIRLTPQGTGSFSEAAKILYSTQPSVSKVVKALEDSLGMQLFERLPRGIRLTPQGREVYRYACKIVNDMKKLENMADIVMPVRLLMI